MTKKRLLKYLSRSIFLILGLFISLLLLKNYIQGSAQKHQEVISQQCLWNTSYAYPYMNDEITMFSITVPFDQDMTFNYCKSDIFGKARVTIADEVTGHTLHSFSASDGNHITSIKLKKGKYIIKANINAFMGSFVLGYGNLNPLEDADNDGLPDLYEKEYGTSNDMADTDSDGLSDYVEVVKYHTNPLLVDSDGDGIIDSDWNERREYTYTIQAIVDLRVPYDIKDMNDSFQDARLIEKIDEHVSRLEVILYPDTSLILNPSPYPKASIQNEYTIPTYTKNYSDKMKNEITEKVKDKETDIEVISYLIRELQKSKNLHLVKDLKMDTDMPLDFTLIRSQDTVTLAPERESTSFSIDEVLEKVFFGDSMYQNKTRGACGSTAILRGTMLRCAGFEERCIFTIPVFYSLKSDNTVFKVKDLYFDEQYINLPDEGSTYWVDHVLNEVLLRNQWIQVDFGIANSMTSLGNPLSIKTLCFNDTTQVDFYNNYANLDFFKERPYKYVSVIEQEKIHATP